MHKLRTIYNPGVAMVYLIQNTRTGETVPAATCGIKDNDFKPWRSPKGTPSGEEFFKMKLGTKRKGFKSITFLNSSNFEKCYSDDGEWEFTGKRPNGGFLPKLSELVHLTNKKAHTSNIINTNRVKTLIEKIEGNNLSISPTQIHTTIKHEEFVDMDEMNKILN